MLGPLPNNLPQNTVYYNVFHPHWDNGWALLAKQLAPKHCKLRCFLTLFAKYVHAYTSKTSKNIVFLPLLFHTVLGPLPNNLFQNAVNFSVFHPHWSNGWALLATQLAPKHCKLRCLLILFAKYVHAYTPKTSKNIVFSPLLCRTVGPLPNNLLQNTVNFNVFHPHWSNGWAAWVQTFLRNNAFCSNGSIHKQLASKHYTFWWLLLIL